MPDGLAVQPNTFQRLMLQWERLAPYNAGQYATIAADVDVGAAATAWRDVSTRLGLQQIGQSPDASVRSIDAAIERFVTDELNRPFAGDDPLRPFVARGPDGSTHLGIVYRHVIADSASIRLLMRAWLARLLDVPRPPERHVAILRDGDFRLVDGRRRWGLLRESFAEFERLSRLKRVRRLPPKSDPSGPVAWRRVTLPDGTIGRLLAAARRENVRVNDLFVAAAAMACHAHLPHEASDHRRDLGVGTIADVRPIDRPPIDHFGLSLGFLQTVWRRRDLDDWQRTLRIAAAQARVARDRRLAEASVLRLAVAARYGARASPAELANLYRKRCPLSAGISNVNLNRDWAAALHPQPLTSYTRVSPLGPMLPLVFTPTTLGQTLHLGVTYRTSVLDEATADAVIATFVDRLIGRS